MKKFWIVFAVIAVLIGGGFGFLWYVVSSLEETVDVEGGVLVWRVGGEYTEERDASFWGQLASGGRMTLSETVFSLRRAAEDDRITGLVLDVRNLDADWAKVGELRSAVAGFQAAGKPVVAHLDGAGTREYALACQADRVIASPEASVMVLGIAAELTFMKETLEKLGMEADFVHVGAYKSAPERMTRSEASKANREMITAIVDDRYEALVAELAASRGVPRATVTGWIDQGMFDAASAVAAGLVDTLLYYDDVFETWFPDEATTDLADYQLAPVRRSRTSHSVALIHVSGVIVPGESRFDRFQGKLAGSETVVDQLRGAGEDDDIDAVILRVDSPGGSALASDLIWNAIRDVQMSKPVIVSMSGMAASGGYYVACLGDSIFADPGTLTGSIGVYAGKMNRAGMYRKLGVNREFITRGDNALLFRDAGGFSPAQRALFQDQLDAFYERFLAKVADGRDLTRDQVHAVAQGRVWTGRQGLERGLVDALGGLERAIASVKWMMGLDESDKITLVTFGEQLTFFERVLLKSLRDNGIAADLARAWLPDDLLLAAAAGGAEPLAAVATALRDDGTLAAMSLLDGRPLAMAPGRIRLR